MKTSLPHPPLDTVTPLDPRLSKRAWFKSSLAAVALHSISCASPRPNPPSNADAQALLLFTSAGKTGFIHADGSGLGWLHVSAPLQETWQPGPAFADGQRILLLSMEKRRDGPGKPFDEYYSQTPTHIWIYHFKTHQLQELATQDRIAPFQTPALLLPGESRMLVQSVRNRVGQIWNMNLDGSDPREFTRPNEGFPYGLSASPDGRRIAFHTAGPSPHNYRIWTSDPDGGNRTLVAGDPAHLYFAPQWSPDGQWLLYQDCLSGKDPGHDWADLRISRPDGSEHRLLTQGQAAWFGATYGPPENRGGGSNVPNWLPDGSIVFSRRRPDSKVPWEYQAHRPDLDHFNRDWKPNSARGGTDIARLNPTTGAIENLTGDASASPTQQWDFRAAPSPTGKWLAFCRCQTGTSPGLWIQSLDSGRRRLLTDGWMGRGADHPRWLSPIVPPPASAGVGQVRR